MPGTERKVREKHQQVLKQTMDNAVANAPAHVRRQLGQPSRLGNALDTPEHGAPKGGRQHNAVGAKFDEYGQTIMRQDPKDLGANSNRRDDREARALELRERYPSIWGERNAAKKILVAEYRRRAKRPKDADDLDYPEPPSIETIRRYIKDFPI